MPSQTGLTTL
jgi:hypothetical protein